MADAALPGDVASAVRSGAVDGYVVKKIACNALAGAVRLVALGEKIFPPEMVAASNCGAIGFRSHGRPDAAGNLSTWELEILSCLVLGDANKIISQRLGISDTSVKMRIKAILRKLHVANRTQAAMWAVSRGLAIVRPPQASHLHEPLIGAARARVEDLPSAAMA
jgi:two-component system nitrate/nitrite response regulator NarL